MVRGWIRAGIPVAAVAAVLLAPQSAYASTTLADGVIATSSATTADYTFSSTTYYWSVVAVAGAADYDLRLTDSGSGTLIGSSVYGTGVTDFVAINSNLRALGPYTATVTRYAGSDPYSVEQAQGHSITTLPRPANDGVSGAGDPDLAFASVSSTDVISVADVYLSAGDAFWANTANTGGNFYLLESNPADPATFIRGRAQATAIAGTRNAQGCTLYTANYSGWHGLVVVNPHPPRVTIPGSGYAYALHRYDPARPNTCPQRDFPGPTPPGP